LRNRIQPCIPNTVTDRFLKSAIAMCEDAGAIHMAHLGRDLEVDFKGDANLVTQVDRLSEETILERIRREYPDHAIVAEESGRHGQAAEYVWYVDPLDGTTNYAHAFPFFGVSIALALRGEMIVAAIYAAALGEMMTATRGGGAWRNGRPMRVSQARTVNDSLLATGFAPRVRQDLCNVDEFAAMLQRSQAVRRPGSASLDLAFVASGRLDGFWEFDLSPWDVAAGSLLVTEAGGRVTQIDGSTFDVEGRAILATNGLVHDEMKEVLASTPFRYRDAVN